MKRFFLIGLMAVLIPLIAYAGGMNQAKVFTSAAIGASGTATSQAYDLQQLNASGFFSLDMTLVGDATIKCEYQTTSTVTNNVPSGFNEPISASDILTGFTKTSGSGSDGTSSFSFAPIPARYLNILCTETGTSNSGTLTSVLNFTKLK